MDYSKLKETIKARRKQQGYNQKTFAKRLGKKQTTYSYIENNLDKASWPTLISILDALDLQIVIIPSDQLKK